MKRMITILAGVSIAMTSLLVLHLLLNTGK